MSRWAQLEGLLRSKYGNRYKRARGKYGIEFRICCPFCLRNVGEADRKYKLYMNPDKNAYHCFRCPAKGALSDLFGAIAWNDGNVFTPPQQSSCLHAVDPPGDLIPLVALPSDHMAIRYLKSRQLDPAVLDRFYGVRYCCAGKTYINGLFNTTNTIVFPVWMHNQLVAWQSRLLYNPDSLTNEECAALGFPQDEDDPTKFMRPPKYFTPPSADKSLLLFNFDSARQCEFVAVSEGPLDAVAIGPAGVATLGKGVSEAQARMLKWYWKLVIILLDPGDADVEMARLKYDTELSTKAVIVKLKGYKDPGEAPTIEIWRQIDEQVRKCGLDLNNYNWGPRWTTDAFRK